MNSYWALQIRIGNDSNIDVACSKTLHASKGKTDNFDNAHAFI